MKALKIIGISTLLLLILMYLSFIFVLPYTIDLNKYSQEIASTIKKSTGLSVGLHGLKLKTAWNLSAGASIEKTDLRYPDETKFAQVNNLQIRLSLIPLIAGKFQLDKIYIEKILLNLDIDKNGRPLLEDIFKQHKNRNLPYNLTYSSKLPDIIIKKYRISFIDYQKENNYTIKGVHLDISDFILGEKIKIATKGELILNNKKQINYDIGLFSKNATKGKLINLNPMEIFEDLEKYNVKANIDTDLKIIEDKIDGQINIDKITCMFDGQTYPPSSLKLAFLGDKTKINASLHTASNSKAIVTGAFKRGNNKRLDLHVKSDKINLKDIIVISKPMLKTFGINKLRNIDANGILKADFDINSDFKKINSDGYLKIKNANINDKDYKAILSSINADIDFSRDTVILKQANAKLNNQPILISGTINKNAFANLSVTAKNLPLISVLIAAGQNKIINENQILNGTINAEAILKGRLDKAIPKINILSQNINLKNKKTKTNIKLKTAKIKINASKQGQGSSEFFDLKIYSQPSILISIPKSNFTFDNKRIIVPSTQLNLNGIKTNFYGNIVDLQSKPKLQSAMMSIPPQTITQINGYPGASASIIGSIKLDGEIENPKIIGEIKVPLIKMPSISTILKNLSIKIGNDILFNCPSMQIANSNMNINAVIKKEMLSGIIVKNVNFSAENLDLNNVIPALKTLPKSSNSEIVVLKGKNSIQNFKIGRITANNILSDVSVKNNILHLNNLSGTAYLGKIAGNISYDFNHKKTILNLQGRGLSANPALIAITGRNDAIRGVLDFDSNINIIGYSKNEIQRSLKGSTGFIISNGQMGALGKLEHLLYAQNIISNNLFRANLNTTIKALTVKNTGVYKYMKGKVTFSEGWANILWVKTSGPSMSLYMTGRYYLPNNTVSLIMLGRISNDVLRILGPIGEFSMNKVVTNIPKIGEITSFIANQFSTNPSYENISQIPPLTPKTEFPTKEFKVIIDGDVQKQSSVKSFKWLASPKVNKIEPQLIQEKPKEPLPDFVKNLPDFNN